MALPELTEAGVRQAVAECDRMGREAFLAAYGFRKAKSYFLLLNGQRYDSKAIVGAAARYSNPGGEPLSSDEFSGGEATVKAVLERLGFEVVYEPSRNPDWSQDELILALEFYVRHRPRIPGQASDEISSLSAEIAKLGRLIHGHASETFRNANGVYMKAMNFRRFDPDFATTGGAGLRRGGSGDERVWKQFADQPAALAKAAAAIRETLAWADKDEDRSEELSLPVEDDLAEAVEGALVTRLHRTRERSKALTQKKKAASLRQHGRLTCEVCAFDFEANYGERGSGFIECHHVRPVSEIQGRGVTRLEDLALLCSNCHRMIHVRAPWLTIAELKAMLAMLP
jgi:5-methylcytosine-specific restriction protein A